MRSRRNPYLTSHHVGPDRNYFEVEVSQPSMEWIITHNLNKYPSVVTFDTAGRQIIGDVVYLDRDRVKVSVREPCHFIEAI
jgi:hypothetical protein